MLVLEIPPVTHSTEGNSAYSSVYGRRDGVEDFGGRTLQRKKGQNVRNEIDNGDFNMDMNSPYPATDPCYSDYKVPAPQSQSP